jgi:hypothetical protein
MQVISTKLPKLCFAKAGDAVQLPDESGTPSGPVFLVCTIPDQVAKTLKMKVPVGQMSNGLYSDDRPFWLVNLETGECRDMPHLSSRCAILRDATVNITEPD